MGLAQAQVGQQLGFVNREQFLDGFQLDDQAIREVDVHDEIVVVNEDSLVGNGKSGHRLKLEIPQPQLINETLLIHRFEQSRSHLSMHFDCGSDDCFRQTVAFFHVFPVFLSVFSVTLWLVYGFHFLTTESQRTQRKRQLAKTEGHAFLPFFLSVSSVTLWLEFGLHQWLYMNSLLLRIAQRTSSTAFCLFGAAST